MLQILMARAKAGVEVRVIGKVEAKWALKGEKPGRRLHVRAIIRDGSRAFLGSQSLRKLQLDNRREIGVIVTDSRIAKRIQAVFESDWAQSVPKKVEKAAEKAAAEATASPAGAR